MMVFLDVDGVSYPATMTREHRSIWDRYGAPMTARVDRISAKYPDGRPLGYVEVMSLLDYPTPEQDLRDHMGAYIRRKLS